MNKNILPNASIRDLKGLSRNQSPLTASLGENSRLTFRRPYLAHSGISVHLRTGVLALTALAMLGTLSAAERWWGTSGSGSFQADANWYLGPNGSISGSSVAPTSNDDAIFDANFVFDPYTVILSGTTQTRRLRVGSDDVSFAMNGFTYTLTAGIGDLLELGRDANESGSLALFNGTLRSNDDAGIGIASGSNMTLTADTLATFDTTGTLRLGVDGIGLLEMKNGGDVHAGNLRVALNSGSSGTISVVGTGSQLDTTGDLIIGERGDGAMVVASSGVVLTGGRASIGADYAGGSGLVTLQTGGKWFGNAFEIGGLADGSLFLSGGSEVHGGEITIAGGQQTGVNGLVELTGNSKLFSTPSLVQDIRVGVQGGTGTLRVLSGSDVVGDYDLEVGVLTGANGVLEISGNGSSATLGGGLVVGVQGTGTATISGGADVLSGEGFIGREAGSDGIVTLSGSGTTWSNTGILRVGHYGDGELNVGAGAVVSASSLSLGTFLDGSGTASVTGNGAAVNLGTGTLRVGAAGTGVLEITGSQSDANPAKVTAGAVILGESATGHGTLRILQGNGGASNVPQNLAMTGVLRVGSAGTGIFEAEDAYFSPSSVVVAYGTGSSGSMDLQGVLLQSSGALTVGRRGTGSLTVGDTLNGSSSLRFDSAPLVVGQFVGAQGSILLTDHSQLTNYDQQSVIGDAGTGSVTIHDQAIVWSDGAILGNQAGSSGTVSIAGSPGSGFAKWSSTKSLTGQEGEFIVGNAGSGLLTVTGSDSTFEVHQSGNSGTARSLVLGDAAGGSGRVDVLSGASIGIQGTTIIGDGGLGTLLVRSTPGDLIPTLANVTYLDVGRGSSGTVTVDGGNASAVAFGLVAGIGAGGVADIDILNAADASLGSVVLGRDGGFAQVTVDGAGSTWKLDYPALNPTLDMTVGESGQAFFVVQNGAQADIGNNLTIGTFDGSEPGVSFRGVGTASIDFGQLNVAGTTVVGDNGLGSLQLTNVSTAVLDGLTIGNQALGNGTLTMDFVSNLTTGDATLGAEGTGLAQLANGSQWQAGNLVLGRFGSGTLNVASGADVTATGAVLGVEAGGLGAVSLTGAGTVLNAGNLLNVGVAGEGSLVLENQAAASALRIDIGQETGGQGEVTVRTAASLAQTQSNSTLSVGGQGTGVLQVESGGDVAAGYLLVGGDGGTGTATITGSGSSLTVANRITLGGIGGSPSTQGNIILLDHATASSGSLRASMGTNSHSSLVLDSSAVLNVAGAVELGFIGDSVVALRGLAAMNSASLQASRSASSSSLVTIESGASWGISGNAVIGDLGAADFTLRSGGQLSTATATLAAGAGSTASVTLWDSGVKWLAEGDFIVAPGGDATVDVFTGAKLETGIEVASGGSGGGDPFCTGATSLADLGAGIGGTAEVTVQGINASWEHHGNVDLGVTASGILRVRSDGLLEAHGALDIGDFGLLEINNGRVDVCGFSSTSVVDFQSGEFYLHGNHTLGDDIGIFLLGGNGITAGRTLGVTGTATLGSDLVLNGGTLEANNLLASSLLDFQSGTLRLNQANIGLGELFDGLLIYDTAFAAAHQLEFQNTTLTESALVVVGDRATFRPGQLTNRGELALDGSAARLITNQITNRGLITGTGRILADVQNELGGEVRADIDDRLVIQGMYHNNEGVLVVEGGRMDVYGDLFNSGQINLVNGSFTANDFVSNSGSMSVTNSTARFESQLSSDGKIQVSGSHAEFFGTVNIQSAGQMLIGSTAQATFYDQLTNNGEVVVGPNAAFISLGTLSGSGIYSGTGTVEILGDFTPGNSPGIVEFDVEAILGSGATLTMELGGLAPGIGYDQLIMHQDITLDGFLELAIYDDFTLGDGMEFTLIQADQDLFGQFIGFDEGALVTQLGGHDVFITYAGGDGNDVVAFTQAIPEPATIVLLALAAVALCMHHRRRGWHLG